MTQFSHDLLLAQAIIAEREREAQAIVRAAEAAGPRRSLRAGWAARLARLALRLDRRAALLWLTGESNPPATNRSPG